MLDTIGERIKYIRQLSNLTMMDISAQTGINKASLSSYENNRYDPSAQVIVKLCELFHVTTDWLLTGRGEMRPPDESPPDPRELQDYQRTAAETFFDNLTPDQAALVDCYEKLTPDEKDEIWLIIKHKLGRKTGLSSNSQTSKDGYGGGTKTA